MNGDERAKRPDDLHAPPAIPPLRRDYSSTRGLDILSRIIVIPGLMVGVVIGEVTEGTWLAIVLVLVAYVLQRPLIRKVEVRRRQVALGLRPRRPSRRH